MLRSGDITRFRPRCYSNRICRDQTKSGSRRIIWAIPRRWCVSVSWDAMTVPRRALALRFSLMPLEGFIAMATSRHGVWCWNPRTGRTTRSCGSGTKVKALNPAEAHILIQCTPRFPRSFPNYSESDSVLTELATEVSQYLGVLTAMDFGRAGAETRSTSSAVIRSFSSILFSRHAEQQNAQSDQHGAEHASHQREIELHHDFNRAAHPKMFHQALRAGSGPMRRTSSSFGGGNSTNSSGQQTKFKSRRRRASDSRSMIFCPGPKLCSTKQ
jgi:hypothetical protein